MTMSSRLSIAKFVVTLIGVMAPVVGAFAGGGTTSQVRLPSLTSSWRSSLAHQGRVRTTTTTTSTTASSSSTTTTTRGSHPSYCTQLSMSGHMSNLVHTIRGGDVITTAASSILQNARNWNQSPTNFFNTSLLAVALSTIIFKVMQKAAASSATTDPAQGIEETNAKPNRIRELQIKFLSVFWLLRCADWLQGPYFYEVYASKLFNGIPASIALVSRLFLTGFASTALFGPLVGRTVDSYGRKRGSLAFAIIYSLGALSTKSPLLHILFLGRVLSGIGTSLLFSAPESWLVGEAQKDGDDPEGKYLGETFGMVRFSIFY